MGLVKRFVAPRRAVDMSVFAPESDNHTLEGIVPFDSLGSRKVTLVLGEPGAGKTTALNDLRESISSTASGTTSHFLDLKDYSEAALGDAFREFATMENSASVRPLLLLDSVDEARFQIRTLVPLLRRKLTPLIDSGWRVVATCRTAETVQAIDGFFESLEEGAIHVLLPLRKSDAVAIANEHKLDVDAFIGVVEQQSLHSLAAIPFTLELLCQAFVEDGAIGATRAEIYDRAVSLLLAQGETTSDGYAPVTRLPAAPSKIRLTAERLAVFVALTDSVGLGVARLGEPMTGLATEYLVGLEEQQGVQFEIGQEEFQTLLQTALFADSGPGQRQFAHRSLRDYLAASCIARWALEPTQLESFLTASNGIASIPPQMLDIATWLVIVDRGRSDWLIEADALNLAKNRVAEYRPELAQKVVAWLLAHAGESNRVFSWHESLQGLAHSALAEQLKPALSAGIDDRLMAMKVLESSYASGLEEDLLQIVLDRALSTRERVSAIQILQSQELREQIAQILPLSDDFFLTDDVAQLRGAVLATLWPDYVQMEQVLALLITPPENYFGNYQSFLMSVERSMTAQDAGTILTWAASQLRPIVADDSESTQIINGRPIRELVEAACSRWMASRQKEPLLFDDLAAICSSYLSRHESQIPVARSQSSLADWRRLLSRIVHFRTSSNDTFHTFFSTHDSDGVPLFTSVDLGWIAKKSVSSPPVLANMWAQIANRILGDEDPAHLEAVWDYRNTDLWAVIGHRYEPIDLDSAEAKNQRHHWQQAQDTYATPPASHSISEAEYTVTVAKITKQLEAEPVAFWHLVRWLDVDLSAGRYLDSLTPDLLDLRSVGVLASEYRSTLLELALSYIMQAPSDTFPKRIRPNFLYLQLTSLYQALHTLEKHSPERLDDADINWGALARPILDYPIHFDSHHANTQIRRRLLGRVRDCDKARLEAEVRKLLSRSLTSKTSDRSIADLFVIATPKIIAHARWALGKSFTPSSPMILELYFAQVPHEATQWAMSRVSESDNPSELAHLFLSLMRHSPEDGFPALYRFAESQRGLAKKVLLKLAQNERSEGLHLASVSEVTLLQLFEWLVDNFPPNEEKFQQGMHAISPREDLADWRENLLRRVVQSGSTSALSSLTALTQRRPDLQLGWALSALRESNRLNGWLPLTVNELHTIQKDSKARLVRSNDDLLAVIVEELDVIQDWHIGETLQAFTLWNQIPSGYQVPKDENSISDWYCHALRLRLQERGLVVNREVEVKRRSQRGLGLRQDIRVEVVNSTDRETYVVVIEVKGIWNDGVSTNLISQLAHGYLIGGDLTHGIYLVVSFEADQVSDVGKRAKIERNQRKIRNGVLEAQAADFRPALQIRAVIHNASLPSQSTAKAKG